MPRQPNVLVFFTDQQRWDTVGRHGNTLDVTPNFDMLSAEGCFVRDSFTCQPVCAPARGALQTGRYPTATGLYRNGLALPEGERTLAHHFREAGYRTGYIGKWHLADDDPVRPEQRGGYDDWLASNILEFTSRPTRRSAGSRRRAKSLSSYYDHPAPAGLADWIRKRAPVIPEDLKALGGTTSAHYPGYMGMVARLDTALGRIADALRSEGMLDDTILLFTSDHGCHFKTRNDEYKRSCHEASIRVPTFLRGPGFAAGSEPARLVSLIDLPPTLLDAAGITPPAQMQDHSILAKGGPDDIFIQISESHVGRALRTRCWKYEMIADDADGWDDMDCDSYREAFLYDLDADPHELVNLIGRRDLAEVRAMLRARLLDRMAMAGEARPRVLPVVDAA